MKMNVATKATMDEPDVTAEKILRAVETGRKEAYLGFPESLSARLNGVWPAFIDMGTHAQNHIARTFAKP